MNNYWNKQGKYQEELNKFNVLTPDWGYTDNKYMDLFLAISKIYYDVYNNGGGNIKDTYTEDIEKYIVPFAKDIKSLRLNVTMNTLIKNFKKLEKLEAFTDEVLLYLSGKDLSYDKHTVYFHYEREELSKDDKDGFSKITFGNYKDYADWVNHRINNWKYKFVS